MQIKDRITEAMANALTKTDQYGFTFHSLGIVLDPEDTLTDIAAEVAKFLPATDRALLQLTRKGTKRASIYQYEIRFNHYQSAKSRTKEWFDAEGNHITLEELLLRYSPLQDAHIMDAHRRNVLFSTGISESDEITLLTHAEVQQLNPDKERLLHTCCDHNFTFMKTEMDDSKRPGQRVTGHFLRHSIGSRLEFALLPPHRFNSLLEFALASDFQANDLTHFFYSALPLADWLCFTRTGYVKTRRWHGEKDEYFNLAPGDQVDAYADWRNMQGESKEVTVQTIHQQIGANNGTNITAFICTVVDAEGNQSMQFIPFTKTQMEGQ